MTIGRIDRRMATSIAARLETIDRPLIREMVSIENISTRGARILSGRHWNAHDRVTMSGCCGGFRASAEIVYCHSLDDGRCAIGLKFNEPLVESISEISYDV